MVFGLIVGAYIIIKLISRRIHVRQEMLERKVDQRTQELILQKEELEDKSLELEKANQEIQTKNIAIEEAFQHLSTSYSKLSDLNRERDGMMSIVAHDLRTPLNNIQGLVQLVSLDGTLNDDQEDYIVKIKDVVFRGNEMIRDLLDITQAKNMDATKIKTAEFDLSEFIQEWSTHFQNRLQEKKQTFEIIGLEKEMKTNSDKGIISRILDNLMSNAMKFSEPGKNIELQVEQLEENIKISLKDEGPGMSKRDKMKMFKPFTKLSARPTSGEPSNGLGLSIIKTLAEKLGGSIEVESEVGVGTTFHITLPTNVSN